MTLIIISSPPTLDLEPIELTLALAAFEQAPKLLFINQGIHYLNIFQNMKKTNGKSPAKIMSVLPMYDCDEVFVAEQSMLNQGLVKEDLHPFCQFLDNQQIKELIKNSKHCVNF